MENVSITNILDKLEDKNKLARLEKELTDFRIHTIRDWLNKKDHKQFHDKSYKDIQSFAKRLLEVANGSKS